MFGGGGVAHNSAPSQSASQSSTPTCPPRRSRRAGQPPRRPVSGGPGDAGGLEAGGSACLQGTHKMFCVVNHPLPLLLGAPPMGEGTCAGFYSR